MEESKPTIRREVQELSLLFDISQILSETLDIREVTGKVLKSMSHNMGMLRGTITLHNKNTGELVIEEAQGLTNKQRERGRYKLGEGVTGKVVKTGIPAVVPRISDEPLFLNKTKARNNFPKKDISFICVPIKMEQEVIGALSADRLFGEGVGFEEDVRLLTIIATLIANAVRLRQKAEEEKKKLRDENTRLVEELKERFTPSNIIGRSKAMLLVYDLIDKVAKSSTTVLIRGESGTGKELIANALHYNSLRANLPFVKVHCAALPETLIESELFGHEKGAFTGATTKRKGRFEIAHGGTIFLDEIGDLSVSTQIKLLRVLQEKEFERVGSNETVKVDVRVLAATNRNLDEMITQGKFRQDLYYRLNVFPIFIPPLKDRKIDIPLLADHFVEKFSLIHNKYIRRISTSAIDMLMSYHWPGNVRELEHCIERSVLLSNDDVIHSHHLPPTLQTAESSDTIASGTLESAVGAVERDIIIEALKAQRGNMAKAARALGITERVMGLRIKKYNIDFNRYKPKYTRK